VPRVVVVDQDRTVLHSIRQALSKANLRINTARSVSRGLALCHQVMPDLVLVEAELAGDGFWAAISELGPKTGIPPVVAMVAAGAASLIIDAAKRGAAEVLAKPLDSRVVRDVVMHVLRGPGVNAGEPLGLPAGTPFVAGSAATHTVLRDVGLAASREVAVLFNGEPGTGKTHLARVVQRHGSRAGAPFTVVDFAGKPPHRIECELFGYERGAFPEAHQRRLGWLERCHSGTVLLDGIDALPWRIQSRLLSIFEEGSLLRIGGDAPIPVNVRMIATSCQDLARLVSQGRFRADLYHALREFSIVLPPLRQRLDDLPQLANWFLSRSVDQTGQPRAAAITAEALDRLAAHSWPGNLWELECVLRRASWRCHRRVISRGDLPEPLQPEARASANDATRSNLVPTQGVAALDAHVRGAIQSESRALYSESVALFDRYICGRVLAQTAGNQSRAARILGMTRRSLRTKTRRFDEGHDAQAGRHRSTAR
jgi:DNA-binding NtrC family response regulator